MEFIKSIWRSFAVLMRSFTIYDLFDIIIVAALIYAVIRLVRESRAGQLVKGILIISVIYLISSQLHLKMLSSLLSNFFQISVFALLIVFQPELRRALEQLGRSGFVEYWRDTYMNKNLDEKDLAYSKLIKIIKNTATYLSEEKTGALIVFERKTKLGEIIDTGTIIKSCPSCELICNIFYNKAPLHDGALIIRDALLYAGGCILPLTKNQNISGNLGTRHRAALGISENSDAIAVVVSEETGKISIAVNGHLKSYDNMNLFEKDLKDHLLKSKIKDVK